MTDSDKKTLPQSLRGLTVELAEHVRKNRALLEHRFDEALHAAINRMHAPLAQHLSALRGRIEYLQKRLDTLQNHANSESVTKDQQIK